MGTRRDEAGVAVAVSARQVIAANREQASELALASRVRLEADGVVAGQLGEPLLQLRDEEEVSPNIRRRREGVNPAEFAPGDGFHFRRGIELHRARPERNHSAVECEVFVGKALEETHHRRLAVVRVEHRVGEDLVRTTKCIRDSRFGHRSNRVRRGLGSKPKNRIDEHVIATSKNSRCRSSRQLVEANLNRVSVRDVEQKSGGVGGGGEFLRLARNSNLNGVKEVAVNNVVAGGLRTASEPIRLLRNVCRNLTQSSRSVIDGIHRREDSEEHLCRANVRGRLVATNVLFASLQSQAVGGSTVRITRDANQATRHLPFESSGHGEERRVGSAETERNTEAL